jgi:hypothetical protein
MGTIVFAPPGTCGNPLKTIPKAKREAEETLIEYLEKQIKQIRSQKEY